MCQVCKEHFEIEEMEGDHIIAWKDGGKTNENNLMMLCKFNNRTKSGK
ncbi:MAG: HNH endonuclease [Bacteroidales bacterium]|nr:HNH endonuclease [Bacteroidales bacterium]